uniref:ABC transporter substrate-binding protein n=1 Tax=Hydrogenophaga sp. TaxID=1904254 RepID=UPI0035617917
AKNVLDVVIVPAASTAKTMADLKGKRIASGPGIQNVTLAKTVLERGGAVGATVVELPIGQHVAALAAGQIDGAYTLEPTGTIGRLNGTTRTLETGVIARYVLGDPMAPWFGGSASLTASFIKQHPEEAKKFVAAYGKGVAYVRSKSSEARQFLKNYTAIEGALTSEVPLAAYTMYNEFTPADVAHFQKFFDLFTEKGVFSKRLVVDSMLYKG